MDLPETRSSWPTIRKLQSSELEPAGFLRFWRETLGELARVDPDPFRLAEPDSAAPTAPTELQITSLGGARIRAWLSRRPVERQTEQRPLLVTCHGYGGRTDPERVRRLGSFGFDVVSFDARGFGLSTDDVKPSTEGYLLTGCESPQTSILRGAVADYVQVARAAELLNGPPSRLVFQGFSFAAGLATMAAGVSLMSTPPPAFRQPDLLAIGAPTFGDNRRRAQLCESGSGYELARYLEAHPDRAEDTLSNLSYFDTVHHAAYVTCRVIAGVGRFDPVVPAMTVYPILNALPHPAELIELPCSHTTRPEEQQWIRWESAWIRATQGRPTYSEAPPAP